MFFVAVVIDVLYSRMIEKTLPWQNNYSYLFIYLFRIWMTLSFVYIVFCLQHIIIHFPRIDLKATYTS